MHRGDVSSHSRQVPLSFVPGAWQTLTESEPLIHMMKERPSVLFLLTMPPWKASHQTI
jgi:hypothetical protein